MLSSVRFDEPTHQYTNAAGVVYCSATQLIGLYKPPFNGPYWTLYKAVERFCEQNSRMGLWWTIKKQCIDRQPKEEKNLLANLELYYPHYCPYFLTLQKIIRVEWEENKDRACSRGTDYHRYRENRSYIQGSETMTGVNIHGLTANSYTFDLRELSDGYHSELLVYNHEYQVAGQIDKTWITTEQVSITQLDRYTAKQIWWIGGLPHIRYVDLDDYKTNKAIKDTNRYDKMKAPLANLPDCNLIHYQLQISLYAWMLEQAGYTPRYVRFTHVRAILDETGLEQPDYITGAPFLADEISYPFTYRQSEINLLLTHYHLNRESLNS